MLLKRLVVFLIFIIIINCNGSPGEFGFAITDDSDKPPLEKHMFVVTEYKMMRNKLIFSPIDTIHFVYKLNGNLFNINHSSTEEFFVSLEKESLGYVEIDLKKKFIDPDSYSIKDKYSNLEIGRYILKVAHEGDVIDSIMFDVVPEDGYSLKEDDPSNQAIESDEIIRYSK